MKFQQIFHSTLVFQRLTSTGIAFENWEHTYDFKEPHSVNFSVFTFDFGIDNISTDKRVKQNQRD
jgi:hypothetical protein